VCSPDVVCFAHLRWDGVFQRPQQLMSRLAHNHRIFYMEEPVFRDTDSPFLEEIQTVEANVRAFRPRFRAHYPFYVGEQIEVISRLSNSLIESEEISNYIGWLYTPMALPVMRALKPLVRVFDCMDELSKFRFAANELKERDIETMSWAELVFTGGRSIHDGRRQMHSNIHCIPSSVDAAHFERALSSSVDEPQDQADIPRPRLAYSGVIDERIDFDLIQGIARSHTDWNIVMVGPFAKLGDHEIPRLPNIHYLGKKTYDSLPAYLKGWDVALLPFALSDVTLALSPTKLLEYMAARRPIISVRLPDVVQFSSAILIADSQQNFIAKCEQALAAPTSQRTLWEDAMRRFVAVSSWDAQSRQIEELLQNTIRLRAQPDVLRTTTGELASQEDGKNWIRTP
jgi:glycosyltransferase involved in cell wall biosynthesis